MNESCPKCQKEVNALAAYCKHCGFHLGDFIPARGMPTLKSVLLYFAFIIACIYLWLWAFPMPSAPAPKQTLPVAGPRG